MNPLFDIICGEKSTWKEDGSFFSQYYDITGYHWQRIKNINILMSENNISPHLISFDDDEKLLEHEIIIPFSSGYPEILNDLNISVGEVKEQIRLKIAKMHNLGYAHGDLSIINIGITEDGEVVLFDFDTAFSIHDDREQEWLYEYIYQGFGEDITFDEFVEFDWENWQTDWLYSSKKN